MVKAMGENRYVLTEILRKSVAVHNPALETGSQRHLPLTVVLG